MKIIIIGAGISGLSTYVALRKYLPEDVLQKSSISIYEKHNADRPTGEVSTVGEMGRSVKNAGVGVNVQANGIRVLKELDPKLREAVLQAGFPTNYLSFRTEGNRELSRINTRFNGESSCLVSRLELVLRLQKLVPEASLQFKDITDVSVQPGQKPVIHFADGSADETADLVIGADGIKSAVRKSVVGNDEKYRPIYDGYCGVGGLLSMPPPRSLLDDPTIVFNISSRGTFGYCPISRSQPDQMLYFSMFNTDLPARNQKPDPAKILESLRTRHSTCGDPIIREAVQKSAGLDTIWPIFLLPKLPFWGRNGCVLVGDAAHALSPSTGQGASQGIEDGQTLALLLSAHLRRPGISETEATDAAIADFYTIREARIGPIRAKAERTKTPKSDLSWSMTMLVYAVIWTLGKVEWISGLFWEDPIHSWRAEDEVEKIMAKYRT